MPTILVTKDLPGDAIERLHRVAGARVVVGAHSAGAVDHDDVVALVAVLTDVVDGARLVGLPNLRVVANVAVGYDNVDVPACRARGVVVTNTPDVLTESTADFAMGLLLAAARRIAEGDRVLRGGGFGGWAPSYMLGTAVSGATLGIVGLGRIGAATARRARAFGMSVLYTQPGRAPAAVERELGATYTSVDALFEESDFVSLHCPLVDATRHLVDAARLARMKPGSVLVNTARGGCVDEAALAHALASGPLAAAGLDVYEREPAVHPALLARDNVVLAPHLGSADRRTREAMARLAADNVVAVLSGEPALTPVR